MPPRTATDTYLAKRGERLDISFDVDLGELIRGHHVIARGIMHGRQIRTRRIDPDLIRELMSRGDPDNGGGFIQWPGGSGPGDEEVTSTEAELHYEFVPALGADAQGFGWYWMLSVSDDVGTEYNENNGGAFDADATGVAAHGSRDLGGQISPAATRLTIRFTPPDDWEPPEPWRREIVVDLREGRLVR